MLNIIPYQTHYVRLFLKYRAISIAIVLFSLLVAFLETVNVATIVPLFESLLNISGTHAAPNTNRVVSIIYEVLRFVPVKDKVISACLFLLLMIVVKSSFDIINEYLMGYLGGKVLYEMRKELIEKYTQMPYSSFVESKHGELMYFALNSPFKLSEIFRKIPLLLAELTKITAIVIFLFSVNTKITLILGILGVLFSLTISYVSKNVSSNIGHARAKTYSQLSILLSELLSGLKQLKVYGSEKNWLTAYNRFNSEYSRIHTKDTVLLALPKNFLEVFGLGLFFGSILIIQFLHPDSILSTLPIMGLFGMAILKMLPSASNFSRTRLEIGSALPEANMMWDILTKDDKGPTFGNEIFQGLKNDIVFENVFFSHKNRTEILKGTNITFKRNQMTALVGDSGSGKTTIINLLLGLFEPNAGKILVNDVPLMDYDLRSWLDHIGFVSQDTFIFHSTIADNISMGDKRFNMSDIIQAAKAANAHEFIMGMPDGYDTIVGDKGMNISGGQQQRLAIARAVLRQPDLLIFDEATSALDNVSEKLVQNAIQKISKQHTVIIVAHRLSTIINADKIAFLKNGSFIEEGTHDELMGKKMNYFQLHMAYSKEQSLERDKVLDVGSSPAKDAN